MIAQHRTGLLRPVPNPVGADLELEYSDALNRYRDLAASHLEAPVKGKANPYTSINGNMFSFLDKAGTICIRLSKADREAFIAKYAVPPVEHYGTVMKDYVSVPSAVLDQSDHVKRWFGLCLENAKALKPKPTKRT